MSNIIPMVSSSPPPMDEGGGFDWEEDDDFGTFTSASDSSFVQSDAGVSHDTPFKSPPVPSHSDTVPHENDFGNFANFESHEDDASLKQYLKNVSNDQRPESIHIAQKSMELEKHEETNSESDSYQNINGPLVDSGVYSSNVSPVQHIESSGSDKVQVHNSENDNKAAQNETLQELSSNLHDDFKTVVEETNGPFKRPLNDYGPVQNDASLSVTQEKVKVIDELEQNDSLKESVQCIPPENIPEIDNVLESGTEETKEENFEKTDVSATDLISNCDDSRNKKSDILESKSTEKENLNSVSSIDSQESVHSRTVCQTDHAKDRSYAGVENDIDLPAENSSDFGDFSSVDQSECNVEKSVSSDKGAEQKSEIVCDVNVIDSCESEDQVSKTQEQNELCNDNSSSEEEVSLQEQTVSITEANSSPENNKSETTSISFEGCKFEDELQGNKDLHKSAEIRENETNVFDSHSENKDETEDVTKSTKTSDTEIAETNSAISDSRENEIKNDKTERKNDCTLVTQLKPLDSGDDSETSFDPHFQENTVPVSNTNVDNKDLGDTKATVDTKKSGTTEEDSDDFGDFSTTDINAGDDFGNFNESVNEKQFVVSSVADEADEDGFGDFNSSFDQMQGVSDAAGDETGEDFGNFNASVGEKENKEQSEDGFWDFNATFDSVPMDSEKTSSDWAAFSEPQIAVSDIIENEDDDWAGFEEEESGTGQKFEDGTSHDPLEADNVPLPDLAHMTKHEKLLYVVTTCFPALVSDLEVGELEQSDLSELHIESDSQVWGHVKGQNTTDALSYQWTKSLWNTQLFSTLHIDTRNILIGHKKAPVPVFAAGLTLLEPTKGQAPLKPNVLVDTSKSDSSLNSHSQESIPAAQFDWSSSGLTNPLEANNKTLNLDFLIQNQATKSNALESEFLSTNESPVHKPAIQPLENILANLKTSSTFKPTNQNEDISQEASKVVKSLPDLVFMKSKVLMFPVKFGGFEK